MIKISYTVLLIGIIWHLSCAGDLEENTFAHMSNHQIDSLLTVVSTKNMTITERMEFYSNYFLEMPYNLNCAGDGEYALYESWPLVNFNQTNCMVFCEHVLALSISDSWDNFFNNLQRIRYKDGMIGMRTRNHYTIGDWLPENNWLLKDVSKKVGGNLTKKLTRTISHTEFFKGKGITDLRYVLPDREITIDYIPKEHLNKIEKNLQTGDIGCLLFAKLDNIFSAHMWMVIKKDGKLIIRESSNSKMSTFDTFYDQWAGKIMNSKRYIGIVLMRVRDDLNTPGKIILPWEIGDMKTSMQ
jgi:hypothetical protein